MILDIHLQLLIFFGGGILKVVGILNVLYCLNLEGLLLHLIKVVFFFLDGFCGGNIYTKMLELTCKKLKCHDIIKNMIYLTF